MNAPIYWLANLIAVALLTFAIYFPRAITDRTALIAYLESLLGGRVHQVQVRKLDLKKKTTQVEVRISAPKSGQLPLGAFAETTAFTKSTTELQLVGSN